MEEKCKGNVVIFTVMWMLLSFSSPHADEGGEGTQPVDYTIGAGDVLVISNWKDESLTKEVVVLPDGTFSFPLIGVVRAEGLTISELKAEVEKRIKKYVPEPVLWVSVRAMNSSYIYVLGRVNNAGRYPLNCTMNVLQALAMAGGLTPFADGDKIKIIRAHQGTPTIISFRYNDVVKGKNLEDNINLRRGDIIIVP